MDRPLKHFFLALFLISSAACGSGSPSPDCDFDFPTLFNGTDAANPVTEWDCNEDNQFFTLAVYANNTGARSDLGSFTWQQNSCDSFIYQSPLGQGQAAGLQIFSDSRQLNYTDEFQGGFSVVNCTLDDTPEGLAP